MCLPWHALLLVVLNSRNPYSGSESAHSCVERTCFRDGCEGSAACEERSGEAGVARGAPGLRWERCGGDAGECGGQLGEGFREGERPSLFV